MGRLGKVAREVVKKALSVIHAKTSLKGLILIILSTYQA
jgi:hypothetical protein